MISIYWIVTQFFIDNQMRVRHEGIPMKRIPVEEYGTLKGNYHLELSNTLEIMSYFRDHKDMTKALEIYLPQTVWKTGEDLEHEDEDVIRRLFYMKKISSQRNVKIYNTIDDWFDWILFVFVVNL